MPSLHFVDDELIQATRKLPKDSNNESEALEEHRFIATCLKMGLRIDDLKQLEYKDVAKLMLCFVENEKKQKTKKATQADWDALARG